MKKSLILYSVLVLLQPACKKDQHTDNAPNTWTLNGKNFQAATVNYFSSGDLNASTYSATGILDFMFSTPPTASGEMLITNSGDPNTIIIEVSQGSGFPFGPIIYKSDKTNIKANVTMGSKVSVSFPGTIWVHEISNYADSVKLSVGTITQL